MIAISRTVSIADNELEITAIRAQGAGGQHVNKTSSAIHLRFDIRASGLPERGYRQAGCRHKRINRGAEKPSRNPSDACLERAPFVLKGAKIFCKGASRQSSSSTGLTGRNSNFIRILWQPVRYLH